MKKTIYYFLMMLCVTLVNVACSNDDGETPDYTVTLTTPKLTSEAKAISGFSIEATHAPGAPRLTAVHITESGEAVFELDNGEQYIVEGIESVNGSAYVLNSGHGTITVSINRASAVKMTIHVNLTAADGTALSYDADNIDINVTTNLDGSEAMGNLCRTWIVRGIVIDLKGDVNAFRELEGGNLYEMATYANEQGAGLTDDEMQELDRDVENVIIEGTGLITFNYSNRASDAATWSWNDDGTKNNDDGTLLSGVIETPRQLNLGMKTLMLIPQTLTLTPTVSYSLVTRDDALEHDYLIDTQGALGNNARRFGRLVYENIPGNTLSLQMEAGKHYSLLLRIGAEHVALKVMSVEDWDFPIRFSPGVAGDFENKIYDHTVDEAH